MTQHTPTPKLMLDNDGMTIRADDESEEILFVQPPDLNKGEYDYIKKAYAAQVVKAVNHHDELVIIAKKMASFIENNVTCETNEVYLVGQELQDKLDAILAKVQS